MGKLTTFNFVSLNGYFEGPKGDIGWHRHGEEEDAYAVEMLGNGGILLFGRVTYELMASYWSSPGAISDSPLVAQGMNAAEKVVFSKTMGSASWNNTKIIRDDVAQATRRLKRSSVKDIAVLGSGSIVSRLAEEDLVDEFQVMVDPVILTTGTVLFKGISRPLNLQLTRTREFKSGVVLLCYRKSPR